MASKKKREELRSESLLSRHPWNRTASKKSPNRKIRRAKYQDTEVVDIATDVAEEVVLKIKKKKKEATKNYAEIEQMCTLRNELVNAVMLIGKSIQA